MRGGLLEVRPMFSGSQDVLTWPLKLAPSGIDQYCPLAHPGCCRESADDTNEVANSAEGPPLRPWVCSRQVRWTASLAVPEDCAEDGVLAEGRRHPPCFR